MSPRQAPPAASSSVRRYVRAPQRDALDDDGLGDGFVSQRRLADLLFRRQIQRIGGGRVECAGACYDLLPAVRLLESVDGQGFELVGMVETIEELAAIGGFLQGNELMLLGSCFRVERGVIAAREATPPMAM